MNAEIEAVEKAEQALEFLQGRAGSLDAELAEARAAFSEVDKLLTNVLGRKALGEAKAKEVTTARDAWNRADQQVRGIESAQTVVAGRMQNAQATLDEARRALIEHTTGIASDLLVKHRTRIAELAEELAQEILITVRLDDAARGHSGMMTEGRSLDLALGGPIESMAARGIRTGASGFMISREPPLMTALELMELSK